VFHKVNCLQIRIISWYYGRKYNEMSDIMRKYIIGCLIGFVLSIGVGAHAEVVNMIGQVIDGAFKVKVNGVELANQAIVVQGTSYLPVREFGEATGYNVGFDADLGITMTKQEVTPSPTPTETPTPADNPKYVRYTQVVKDIEKISNEKLALEDKINVIKTTHATENQNVDDLKQQVADKQVQLDKLVEEKHTLEAELFPQQ
jgi:hypothetical protein